ncbi:MAG: Maf family protein [Hyphomicrobiaceae bacterium]|nr:Maf family protein [Hyphomicrobiaceae bacterium]
MSGSAFASPPGNRPLVLASASRIRQEIMKSAGLAFTVDPADIDEPAVRRQLTVDDPSIAPGEVAVALARAKGLSVSARQPGSLVIAADQILALGSEVFAKPSTLDEARHTLMRLRGQTHELVSAVALAQDGDIVWDASDTARMTMRRFSAAFVSEYLLRAGSDVCSSVGAYQLEGLGIQLFDEIDGDYFTILGLPLLPLLEQLRTRGAMMT